jgi:cation-transporting P-type ATPase C
MPYDSELLFKLTAISFTILRESTEGIFLIALIDFTNYVKLSADLKCQRLLQNSLIQPPNTAWIITSTGNELLSAVHSLQIGDIIFIHKNEVVPAEGEVIEGTAMISYLYYTGQPVVSSIKEGNKIYEGVIVLSGKLKVRVLKIPDTLNKKDIPLERLYLNEKVAKFQEEIVPVAMVLATISYLLTGDILNALSTILVFCPASSDLALRCGMQNYSYLLSKHNIYIRNPNTLEKIINTNSIIFDKTGTLTYGNMRIVSIESFNQNYNKEDLLKICTVCEAANYHPISITLQEKLKKINSSSISNTDYDIKNVQDSILVPSRGIRAVYNNHSVLIGNTEFFKENHISLGSALDKYLNCEKNFYTPILISVDNCLAGIIVMEEIIRDNAYTLIDNLKHKGITSISLLTGDHYDKAKYISDKLGIANTYGDCNLEEKAKIIEQHKLQNTVMMVGDGINDIAAMKASDISVSFASSSCDKIKLDSDCIIFDDDINRLSDLIVLSKETYSKINKNIKFANLYNVTFGTMAFLGIFNIFAAKSIDTINSIFVLILNERIKLDASKKTRYHSRQF